MSSGSPFSQAAQAAAAQSSKPVPVKPHPAAETDIYRTFSPSEIAYWDFGKDKSGAPGEPLARKGSMGGLFSKIGSLFGSSASK